MGSLLVRYTCTGGMECARYANPTEGKPGASCPDCRIDHTKYVAEIKYGDTDEMQTTGPLPTYDNIFRPSHYAEGVAIEPITFIMANKLPFCEGNVIKYVCRYQKKNGVEDLRKARRYLDMLIESIENPRAVDPL